MDNDDLHLQLAAINARLCGFTNTARALEQAFSLKRSDERPSQRDRCCDSPQVRRARALAVREHREQQHNAPVWPVRTRKSQTHRTAAAPD